MKLGLRTKLPQPSNIYEKTAQETMAHVTAATLSDLQQKLNIKFPHLIRAAKTSTGNEVAPHFTLS